VDEAVRANIRPSTNGSNGGSASIGDEHYGVKVWKDEDEWSVSLIFSPGV
jgi:hypothetical protein